MSGAAFTPGPWTATPGDSIVRIMAGLNPIAATTKYYWQRYDESDLANATLIASAPDLYAALADMMENPLFQVAVGGNSSAVDQLLERARAALAKASGR